MSEKITQKTPDEAADAFIKAAWERKHPGDPYEATIGGTALKSLIIPSEEVSIKYLSSGINNELLVVDKRRITPESVEADFQANEEKLRSPLSSEDTLDAIQKIGDRLQRDYKDLERKYNLSDEERVGLHDMEGDLRALHRLTQLYRGDALPDGNDYANKRKGMGIEDRIDDVIGIYSELRPRESEEENRYIASTGGMVGGDSETGEVHFAGYNNAIFYTYLRAKQIVEQFQTNPRDVREKILATDIPDYQWLREEPVIDPRVRELQSV